MLTLIGFLLLSAWFIELSFCLTSIIVATPAKYDRDVYLATSDILYWKTEKINERRKLGSVPHNWTVVIAQPPFPGIHSVITKLLVS